MLLCSLRVPRLRISLVSTCRSMEVDLLCRSYVLLLVRDGRRHVGETSIWFTSSLTVSVSPVAVAQTSAAHT